MIIVLTVFNHYFSFSLFNSVLLAIITKSSPYLILLGDLLFILIPCSQSNVFDSSACYSSGTAAEENFIVSWIVL